ncbi:M1 family metallopeptidase [Terrimonas pollutisoli]|uniref:M1 family metallopeptidase n=1 Tax=Terrimonas pollutisoli TaxID=3034147 RepID=UPI0023EAC1B4|nr:M1 family metallopeptidase [Terrimonas sp. H1YJ31]
MKKLAICIVVLMTTISSFAQSNYNAKEAFNPQFYPYPGNDFRSASGEPGPKYWQNRADYKINCTLDTATHGVSGEVEITYINNSPDNLKFLWLQLDQNIYKKDSRGSATTTEAGGRWANGAFTEGDVIKSVGVETGGKSYAAKYMVTDTRMQVWLQEPLKASGGKTKLNIKFNFTVPEYGTDRMGRLNTKYGWVYEVAQWFPRLAVYDDIQGWNVLPYLGAGEFYLEYGDFEYYITAPSDLIVVGSGELLNPQDCFAADQLKKYNEAKTSDKTVTVRSEKDITDKKAPAKKGNITWKFKIQNARDVAWGASKAFILDAAKINLPSGKKCLAISAYPVESTKDKKGNDWRRSTEMVKGSIEHYSNKWFEFPYPAATNVAGIVGGMEYPGIVFCSYTSTGTGLWGVTDHEFGHTWFPMIVGSNERKYAWMDEGFNTFINDLSTEAFNKGEFKQQSFFEDPSSSFMIKYTFGDKMDGLYTTPDVIQQENLGVAAYMKPSMMLHALREVVLTPERFDAAFREYVSRWAFKHPTPWDFFHTMENVAGEDLGWFWRAWVLNTWKLDQSVKEVKYVKNIPENGATITLENLEKMPMPVTVLVKEANGKEHKLDLPVEVWQRGPQWTFGVPTTSEIKEVVLDPDKKLPDWNRDNNKWKKAF